MTVKVSKPAINVREELADLKKPTGIAGEAMLRAETPQEQFNLIGAGRRNLIINGAMQVAQRGTSATTFAYGTVDRFKPTEGSTSSLAITQTQDTDAPSGFSNSLKVTVTTSETMSGSKQLAVFHAIEAQNLQQLGYGTFEAQYITVSFWVKSSVTGAYCLSLYENDDNRNIGATYTINSANTWEYKTITFPPDTVGVIDNNNGGGLETYFFLSVGPDRKTADNTSWATWSAARFGYGQVADVAGTTNATWQITGVQLELGKVATPFEHRSYGEELALCQRYFEKSYNQGTALATATHLGSRSSGGNAAANTTGEIGGYFPFIVTKRAAPSVTIWDQSGNQGKTTISLYGTGTTANQTSSVSNISETVFFVSRSSGANATELYVQFAADAEL